MIHRTDLIVLKISKRYQKKQNINMTLTEGTRARFGYFKL